MHFTFYAFVNVTRNAYIYIYISLNTHTHKHTDKYKNIKKKESEINKVL